VSSLTLLGTGTCQIEHERRASSVLLELDGTHILFDCGHGVVQRLLEVGVQHNELQHIVFSHFHADHISDVIPFLQAGAFSRRNPRTSNVHIYGPAGVQAIMNGLLQVFGPAALQQATYQIVVHEVPTGPFEIAAHRFDFIGLPPAGNHGLRFAWRGKRYAVTGDSYFHAQEIEFLRDIDLAVIDSGHISDEEIVQLASASQAKTIICSHLYREIDARRLQALAEQQGYAGTILVGRDLMSFVLQ
jgi:ribonuclease BN (tRNA processing enzyme)